MAPVMKKIVRLRIKVPANVTVVTELLHTPAQVGVAGAGGMVGAPSTLEMDLTTQKTSQWLSGVRRIAAADCNCCCVRG